jgi:hypothetical protein
MNYEYSKNVLVRDSAADLLGSLGWEPVYAHNNESLGENGTLGRDSQRRHERVRLHGRYYFPLYPQCCILCQ